MRHNLEIDRYKSKPENYIKEEIIHNISANVPIRLIHDIFYKEDFKVYKNVSNKNGSKLEIGIDYSLEEADEISTFDSQRLCYRKVVFHADQEQVYVDYWVYGDSLTAEMFNELEERLDTAEEAIDTAENEIDGLDTRLTTSERVLSQTVENVSTLDTRINAAERNIENIGEALGGDGESPGLIQQVSDIEDTLNTEKTGIVDRVEAIEETLNTQDTGVVDRLETVEETLNTENTGLVDRLEEVEDTLNTQTTGIVDRVEAIEETLNTQDTGVVDRLEEVENTLTGNGGNDPGLSNRVDNIENALTGNGTNNPGLISKVATNKNNIEFINEILTDSEDGLISRVENIEGSKNEPNGIAGLDEEGKIPTSLIPSFIGKEIVEVDSYSSLPTEGESGKIYITTNDNHLYRWENGEYKSLASTGSGGGGLYAFEVGTDGYLYMICEDGSNPPTFFIDNDGYLCADLGNLADQPDYQAQGGVKNMVIRIGYVRGSQGEPGPPGPVYPGAQLVIDRVDRLEEEIDACVLNVQEMGSIYLKKDSRGANNGVAELDGDGLVPEYRLPSNIAWVGGNILVNFNSLIGKIVESGIFNDAEGQIEC
jgi:peptidoglycan hydrolase CwlO-like protein